MKLHYTLNRLNQVNILNILNRLKRLNRPNRLNRRNTLKTLNIMNRLNRQPLAKPVGLLNICGSPLYLRTPIQGKICRVQPQPGSLELG